jgi:membrane protein
MENQEDSFLTRITSLEGKTGLKLRLAIFFKLTVVSFYKFLQDDCLTKASAISYTTLVSLIPTLTVALAFLTITSGFNEKQSEVFDQIRTFLQKNDVKVDITPYLETLREIVGSATQIGTVGFVVLIFSATAILRTLETAFNEIWNVSTSRPFLYKIILFFFILSVGPLLFVILLGFSSKFADMLRPPHLYSIIKDSNQNLWITGEKGTIFKVNENGEKVLRLSSLKIDYENMKCVNVDTGNFLNVCDPPNLFREDFIKVRSKNKTIYVLSQKGVLLHSDNLGENWYITEFLNTTFRDFAIVDSSTVLLIKESGDVLKFSRPNNLQKVILKLEDLNINANRVRFYDSKLGFILDTIGNIWTSKDGGQNFTPYNLGKFRLEDIVVVSPMEYYIVGERGSIFRTTNFGQSWKDLSHKNITFTKVWYLQEGDTSYLIVLNNFDQILYSTNKGETWEVSQYQQNGNLLSMTPINPKFGTKAINPDDDDENILLQDENPSGSPKAIIGDILAVGQFNKITIGDFKEGKIFWHNLSGGDSIYSPYSILNFIIPLIAIWIFFLMLYILIPNTRVPIRTGMIGALITSILFLGFMYGFAIYIKSFSTSTMIIYRALAAVPLFLLFIYGTSLIVLLGAEITSTLQFKNRYIYNPGLLSGPKEMEKFNFFKIVEILAFTYYEQKKNHKAISLNSLLIKFSINETELQKIIDKLIDENYLLMSEKKEVLPIVPAEELTVFEIYKLVVSETFMVPKGIENNLATLLEERFAKIGKFTENELKSLTFASII